MRSYWIRTFAICFSSTFFFSIICYIWTSGSFLVVNYCIVSQIQCIFLLIEKHLPVFFFYLFIVHSGHRGFLCGEAAFCLPLNRPLRNICSLNSTTKPFLLSCQQTFLPSSAVSVRGAFILPSWFFPTGIF